MANAPHKLLLELKDLMAKDMDETELDALIFNLEIRDLPKRPTQVLKAQEVVTYLDRRNRLPLLGEIGPTVRDDLPWQATLERYGYAPATPAPATTTEISYLDIQKLAPILADDAGFLSPGTRKAFLAMAGVGSLLKVNLDGAPLLVAAGVLDELNRYGRTSEGDVALARLLTYLSNDPTLPPARKQIIDEIITRNRLV